ncbi:MAG: type IV pilus secretin PilQ, partial [Myxococcota bacterium]
FARASSKALRRFSWAKEQERLGAIEQARKAEEARLAQLGKARSKEEERLAKAKKARQKEESARALEEERLAKAKEARKREEKRLAKVKEGVRASKNNPNGVTSLNVVKAIRFQENGDGVSRIIVEMDRPSNFQTVPWSKGKAKLKLNGVSLPKSLERSLDTRAFEGTVRFVNSFQDKSGTVHVEAEIPNATTEIVRQDGSKLIWEFTSAGSDKPAQAPAQSPGNVAALPIPTSQGPTSQGPRNFAPTRSGGNIYGDPDWLRRPTNMARKRLDIDLRNADIQNVLRLFAREGNVNIVTGDKVDGSVTMRLQNVPIADAFLVILKSLDLGYEEDNGIYRVDTAKSFSDEADAIRARLQASFPTQPLEVILVPVNYAEAQNMSQLIGTVLSSRGSVAVDRRTNTLVIKDVAENIVAAQQLVYSLDTQTPQVLIEARIVETNDRYIRQFGIQWGGDWLFSEANGNPTGLTFPSIVGISGAANDGQAPVSGLAGNPNFAVNRPAPIGTGSGGGIGLTLGSVGNRANLALRLTALEEEGHIKIVSSPKIMTLDNRAASISQGTSIPISVVSAQGVQTQFVQANLSITVTPHVTQDGNIQLELLLSKSEPDFENTGARGDPTIITKDASTELMLADGDTTVIGGIYSQTSGNSRSKVPWLGDVPILGLFFRSYSENETRTELLIFVTPRIINREAALASRKLSPVTSPQAPAKDQGTP